MHLMLGEFLDYETKSALGLSHNFICSACMTNGYGE